MAPKHHIIQFSKTQLGFKNSRNFLFDWEDNTNHFSNEDELLHTSKERHHLGCFII